MGLGIPPLKAKILLESNPLESIISVRRLTVCLSASFHASFAVFDGKLELLPPLRAEPRPAHARFRRFRTGTTGILRRPCLARAPRAGEVVVYRAAVAWHA